MTQSRRIVKNAFFGVTGEVVGGAINFLTTVIIARSLGVASFGTFSFVLAYVGIFQVVADLGVRHILIRDVAADVSHAARIFGETKTLIWILSFGAFALIAGGIPVVAHSREVAQSILIAGIAVLASFHSTAYSAVCRAYEEMEYSAAGFVLHKVVFLLFTVAAVRLGVGLPSLFVALLLSNLALWVFSYEVVRRRYFKPALILDLSRCRSLFREMLPLGVASILRRISWQVDTLILSWIGTVTAVGLFNAGYKVIQVINFLPLTLTLPAFPLLARLAKGSPEALFKAHDRILKVLLVLAFPIAVVLTVLARPLIVAFYGPEYADAAEALALLSWGILLLFPTSLYVFLFTAMGLQKLYTIASAACLAMNVVLAIALIPRYSYIGACVATLAAEGTLFVTGLYFIRKLGGKTDFVALSWKPIAASAILGGVLYLWPGTSLFQMVAHGIVGLALYGIALGLLRVFSADELAVVREVVGKRLMSLGRSADSESRG